MAHIKQYTDEIRNAIYGEEVRGSIISALEKVNDDNNSYQQLKVDVVQAKNVVEASKGEIDQKINSFKNDTSLAEQAQLELRKAIKDGNTTLDSLGTINTDLANNINSAGKLNTELESNYSKAQQGKNDIVEASKNIDKSLSTAQGLQTSLDSLVDESNQARIALAKEKTGADSLIRSLGSANTEAKSTLESLGTTNTDLAKNIAKAEPLNTSLESLRTDGTQLKNSLTTLNESAGGKIETLTSQNLEAKNNIAAMEEIATNADLKNYAKKSDLENISNIKFIEFEDYQALGEEKQNSNIVYVVTNIGKVGGVFVKGATIFRDDKVLYLAKDSDFSGTRDSEFKYIGDSKIVYIPHVIKGVPVTNYKKMFQQTNVEKVISDNPNVIYMASMFHYAKTKTLDLSEFDATSIRAGGYAFQGMMDVTVYTRTQEDADKFKSFEGNYNMTFVVKR